MQIKQMIKRRKESDRGDWPENLLLLQCYVHRLRDAFAELDKLITTRMWANAQPDGRPAEHRWRPLYNAAKFG